MAEETMRIAAITGIRQVELWEVPRPQPGPGEVLVRSKACALCTWEQRTYSGVDQGARLPFADGHEYAGVVEQIGPDTETALQVGDHVAVGSAGCGQCHYCRIGETSKCTVMYSRLREYEGLWGPMGLADYRLTRAENVYKLAPDLPFEQGALSEPLACVVHAERRLEIGLAENVLVIGAGPMGLLNMLVAKARGAKVIVSELLEVRRQKALALGAHATLDPQAVDMAQAVREVTDGRGADVVIVAIGNATANRQALEVIAPLGRMMLFASAHPPEDLCLDPNWVHRQQVSITSSRHGDVRGFEAATKALSDRLIDVEPLIEATMPLEEIEAALELAIQPETYRVVLTM
jgi:L-iditol 2-dehydrogenase